MMAGELDGENRAAWVLALAYSGSEQQSLEEEVALLQACLDAILRLERAQGFKTREKTHQEHFTSFRKALTALAVYRTKEKQKRSQAKASLEKTKNELRFQGFDVPEEK